MGKFAEANSLFELALFRHKTLAESTAVATASSNPTSLEMETRADELKPQTHDNATQCDAQYDEGYDDLSLDSYYRDMDEIEDEDDGCPRVGFLETPVILSSQSDRNIGPLHVISPALPRQNQRIRRMTTSSVLHIAPFCGQYQCCVDQENTKSTAEEEAQNHHHEVYCLPIVMDDAEWVLASIEDKTFILIFNTAICNHLWGMNIQMEYSYPHHHHQHQHQQEHSMKRALLVANSLYRWGLDIASRVGNPCHYGSSRDMVIIDCHLCICIVVILNNTSHVLKTLEGPHSAEGHMFDQLLLKAIFWWRDSQEQRHRQGSSLQQDDPRGHSSNYDVYEEDEEEIIDSFLDNVFYLIGLPNQIAPAAAA